MGVRGTSTPEKPRRARRLRVVAWATTGLTSALLLIGGSLAALNSQVLDGGSWHSYADGDGETIVLAPSEGPAGTGGVRGPVDVLAAPEEPQPSLGGEAAPDETPAIQADPVDEPQTPSKDRPEGEPQADTMIRASRPAAPARGHVVRAARDTDRDGLSDTTEKRLGTDPGASDTDGDDVPNQIEQNLPGMDPTFADSNGDGKADGADDGDGLPNATEVGLGTDPATQDSDGDGEGDGADDSDGDGRSNAEESAQGDDPGAVSARPAETAGAP